MIKKNKILIYWFLILTLIGIKNVNAWTGGISFADTGGETQKENEEENPWPMGSEKSGNTTIIYTCDYEYTVSADSSVTINGYDLNDKSIMTNSLKITDENRILAGTTIGLSISEYKKVEWNVTKAIAMEQTVTDNTYTKYKCTYSKEVDCNDPVDMVTFCSINLFSRIKFVELSCSSITEYVYGTNSCPSHEGCVANKSYYSTETTTTSSSFVPTSNPDKQKECEDHATEKATSAAKKLLYSSYKVDLPDSNEVGGNSITPLEATGETPTPSGKTGSAETTYHYKPQKVCLNVLTAEVNYILTNSDCNPSEIEIEDGSNHWHYFVPLSAKSNYQMSVNLMPSNKGILNESQCKYVMENNPKTEDTPATETTYIDLIVKADKTDFAGDYYKGDAGLDAKSIKDGCYLTSKVKIPIVQKFYNEVTDNKGNITFKGFNFYYRPISMDYNQKSEVPSVVFPNGVATNSLWYEWSENWKENEYNPDFTQSFENIAYETGYLIPKKIREYNKANPYTSWQKMTTSGKSLYINNGDNSITRKTTGSIYKLGCGPSNADWGGCK